MPQRSRSRSSRWFGVLLLIAAAVVAGCATPPARGGDSALPWQSARQMVLVVVPDWNATRGRLATFARSGDGWRQVGSADAVVIGRNGAAWGIGLNATHPDGGQVKREGDGRSPAGVFRIGDAFGYASTLATALRYRPLTPSDWCVDVSGSPYYNRIVDAKQVGAAAVKGASEHMRLDLADADDMRYQRGFVIEHNHSQVAMGGSCIFAHQWAGPDSTTAGCTAMAPSTMQRLLAWLDPRRDPVFVLLTARDYAALRGAWHLPAIGGRR